MKKFVIVGSGSAGLIAASMIKTYWKDKVDITVIHDKRQGSIAVGESTTPAINAFLTFCGIPEKDLIRDLDVTIKLGINFKNWIPDTEYFHGFGQITGQNGWNKLRSSDPSATYSILNDVYSGGSLYNEPMTKVPTNIFDNFSHALHIDTRQFTDYLYEKLNGDIKFVDDVVTRVRVNTECTKIESIECKYNGVFDADYFIDASGFNTILFKHLNPRWNDISKYLPIDRAIPQQVPYNFKNELPSYTLAEATDNGWIWRIPIGDRYGTGYLYSSKFTSDEEAREKYNDWLVENFDTKLTSDRIIRYRPGYYEDYWMGNCLAVGLSSGFVEPLESTGLHIVITQVLNFIRYNSSLKSLEFDKKSVNKISRDFYIDTINFVCLHYNTNRTDSEFWKYITENKLDWVKDVEQKCKEDFLDITFFRNNPTHNIWPLESYISVAQGLNMFSKDGIQNYLNSKSNGKGMIEDGNEILEFAKNKYKNQTHQKNIQEFVSHKQIINSIHK